MKLCGEHLSKDTRILLAHRGINKCAASMDDMLAFVAVQTKPQCIINIFSARHVAPVTQSHWSHEKQIKIIQVLKLKKSYLWMEIKLRLQIRELLEKPRRLMTTDPFGVIWHMRPPMPPKPPVIIYPAPSMRGLI